MGDGAPGFVLGGCFFAFNGAVGDVEGDGDVAFGDCVVWVDDCVWVVFDGVDVAGEVAAGLCFFGAF